MNISIGWLRFISIVAFSSAVATGIASLVAYGFGFDTPFPTLTIGTISFLFSFINHGYLFAGVYVISNLLDALTPQVSERWNRLGKVGSAVALALLSLTVALVFGQYFASGDNIQRILETSWSSQFLAGLFIFSLFDMFVLQRIKNRSLARHEMAPAHDDAHGHDHGASPDVSAMVRRVNGTPLIGGQFRDCSFVSFAIDCQGKDVRILPPLRPGDPPQVEVIEPRADVPHAA